MNGFVYLISVSDSLLSTYRSYIEFWIFCILQFYWICCLVLTIFGGVFRVFYICNMRSANSDTLLCNLGVFYFSWLNSLAGTSKVLKLLSHFQLFANTWTSPPGPFVLGDAPGRNTGVGCHASFQGSPNPGMEPRQILYCLSHREVQEYWSG